MWYKTEDLNKENFVSKEHTKKVKPVKTIWLDTTGASDFKKSSKIKHHERRVGRVYKDFM